MTIIYKASYFSHSSVSVAQLLATLHLLTQTNLDFRTAYIKAESVFLIHPNAPLIQLISPKSNQALPSFHSAYKILKQYLQGIFQLFDRMVDNKAFTEAPLTKAEMLCLSSFERQQ